MRKNKVETKLLPTPMPRSEPISPHRTRETAGLPDTVQQWTVNFVAITSRMLLLSFTQTKLYDGSTICSLLLPARNASPFSIGVLPVGRSRPVIVGIVKVVFANTVATSGWMHHCPARFSRQFAPSIISTSSPIALWTPVVWNSFFSFFLFSACLSFSGFADERQLSVRALRFPII